MTQLQISKANQILAQIKNLTTEDKVTIIHEVAKELNLKVVDPKSSSTGSKKWATAQAFYDHLVAKTDAVINEVKAKKITWEAGARKLMGTKEFEAEVADFSDKGKERLKGELNRMVRKFAKDTNIDVDKVLKTWDTLKPGAITEVIVEPTKEPTKETTTEPAKPATEPTKA